MGEGFKKFIDVLGALITYSEIGDEKLDRFFYDYVAAVLSWAALIGLLVFVLVNPNIRKRKRSEDRIIFSVCLLLFGLLAVKLFYSNIGLFSGHWVNYVYYVAPTLMELLYMLTIMVWMIFVDHCMYRSVEHIKRRYKHAMIPIVVVIAVDIYQSWLIYGTIIDTEERFYFILAVATVLKWLEIIVEVGYILTAAYVVIRSGKESREPRFLRLGAFVIPFVFASLFRCYDVAAVSLGIVLTYGAVKRHDKYIDHKTGFYNRDYLTFLSKYRDQKAYTGGNGILINAQGHGEDMTEILKELKPADSNIITLGDDRFLLLSETLRGSAVKMAVMTITEAAETGSEPYTPEITVIKRLQDESAGEFASRLLQSSTQDDAAPKGVVS